MRFPPNGPRIEYIRHDSPWDRLGHLLALVVVAALITVVVVLVLRLLDRPALGGATTAAAAIPVTAVTPVADDAALAQLRLRYASGDVSRDDYLRTASDLGAPVPVPDEPPPGA